MTLAVDASADHVKAAVSLNPKFVQDPVVRAVIHAFVGDYTQAVEALSDLMTRGATMMNMLNRLCKYGLL